MRFNIIVLFLLITVSLSGQKSYTITGEIENAGNSAMALLYYPQKDGYFIDSCYIENGHFSFSGSVEYPLIAYLTIKEKETASQNNQPDVLNFYLENTLIRIISNRSITKATVLGSRTHNLHLEFMELLKPINEEMNNIRMTYNNASPEQRASKTFTDSLMKRELAARKKNSESAYQFVEKHPTDIFSVYLLQSQLSNAPDDILQIGTLFSALSDNVRESGLGKEFAGQLQKVEATGIGKTAPQFTCNDINGNSINLSDFKGKYLLLMFWSPNCDHCLEEVPNVKKAFQLFSEKDFNILSIASVPSENKKDLQDFIVNNQLIWPNIIDEQKNGEGIIANLYNVRRTPYNFLLNKDGKIVAKEVYGEDLINRLNVILEMSRRK